jgi:hypothetical protein
VLLELLLEVVLVVVLQLLVSMLLLLLLLLMLLMLLLLVFVLLMLKLLMLILPVEFLLVVLLLLPVLLLPQQLLLLLMLMLDMQPRWHWEGLLRLPEGRVALPLQGQILHERRVLLALFWARARWEGRGAAAGEVGGEVVVLGALRQHVARLRKEQEAGESVGRHSMSTVVKGYEIRRRHAAMMVMDAGINNAGQIIMVRPVSGPASLRENRSP